MAHPHFLENTFDNMSVHETSANYGGGLLSDLLRDNVGRSRFISDETMFGKNDLLINDIPDKTSFDKDVAEEESKDTLPKYRDMAPPYELLLGAMPRDEPSRFDDNLM